MSRILVVEDEAIIAKDLQQTLQAMGHEVPEPISRGQDAIDAARRLKPDLVLMDIHLAGDMDGTQAARLIAQQGDPAIIFLTAYADEETVKQAQASAPYGYLVKPYDDATLRTTIATALHKRAADQQRQHELHLQKDVLKQLPQAILLTDESARISSANPAARAVLGEVEGQSLTELLGLDDVQLLWQRLLDRHETVEWHSNGRETVLSAHRVGDGILVVISMGPERATHQQMAARAVKEFQGRVHGVL